MSAAQPRPYEPFASQEPSDSSGVEKAAPKPYEPSSEQSHFNPFEEAEKARANGITSTMSSSSAPSSLSFQKALITGGSGGLGYAMAESLIKAGKKVILVGRTESKLVEAAKTLGAEAYYMLDTSQIAAIPDFVRRVTTDHPDVDCLINNAGVQRPFQFPGTAGEEDYPFDLTKADQELDTNIRGPMHLIIQLLPHLQTKDHAVVMNVTSVLGFNPISLVSPVYNGTKAWLHFFTVNLRTQLQQRQNQNNIKVIEIVPPTVETDLHRERKDPNDNKRSGGNASAVSVADFIAGVEKGWEEDRDTIAPGPARAFVEKWHEVYGEAYRKATASS